MDNLEGDVSYLTVKDTEPGNKQGEDGPANLTANKNERRSSKKS